jgi:TetR/AcrR family transcriptional repressor of lmrAB and yxaGH operons
MMPDVPAAPSARPHLPTRERLLRAGIQLFQANGYHGTGVAEILKVTALTKGSFYHHFPGGKEELAVEALRWLGREVDTYLDQMLAEQRGAADLVVGMARYAALGLRHRDRMRGSLVTVLAQEAVPSSALIEAALRSVTGGWRTRLAAAFASGGETDQADDFAAVALALIEGATVVARIAGDAALIERYVTLALAAIEKK